MSHLPVSSVTRRAAITNLAVEQQKPKELSLEKMEREDGDRLGRG